MPTCSELTECQQGLSSNLGVSAAIAAAVYPDEPLAEIDIPESLRDNLALFLRLERKVLKEYDPEICQLFDVLLSDAIKANEGQPGQRRRGRADRRAGHPAGD